jgi:hypothetical protein
MITLVFCHGLPFNKDFFAPLIHALKDDFNIVEVDLGYYGNAYLPNVHECTNAIAIGHSLGFFKLLELGYNFKAFVGISTFTKYNISESNARALFHLKYVIGRIPRYAFIGYLQRLKIPDVIFNYSQLNAEKLINDINLLDSLDCSTLIKETKNQGKEFLFLFGEKDLFFPCEIAQEQFIDYNFIIKQNAGHELGFLHTSWCKEKIVEFINKIFAKL